MARLLELVGDQAVAELRVVSVDVDDDVHHVGVVEIPGTGGVLVPLVERLD
jgi:hypothetical protein